MRGVRKMKSYYLDGLDCANCAMKIEKKVNEIKGVKQATVNFTTCKLTIEASDKDLATIENETKRVVKEVEPDVSMKEITKKKQEVQ